MSLETDIIFFCPMNLIQALVTVAKGSMVHRPLNMIQSLSAVTKGILTQRRINIIQSIFIVTCMVHVAST